MHKEADGTDLLVADHWRFIVGALVEEAMRELAREHAARNDRKGPLEAASSRHDGLSCLRGVIDEMGGCDTTRMRGAASSGCRPSSSEHSRALNMTVERPHGEAGGRHNGCAHVRPLLDAQVEVLAHQHARAGIVGVRLGVSADVGRREPRINSA